MASSIARVIPWDGHALCSRYAALLFTTERVPVYRQSKQAVASVRWALGSLADGQDEVLHVWPQVEAGATDWHDIFEDLRVRGVEQARFLVNNEPDWLRVPSSKLSSSATVLALMGQVMRQGLEGVSARDLSAAGEMLESLRTSCTADAARSAVARLRAAPFGAKFQAKVERWEAAVGQSEPFFALAPRLQRFMLAADSVVGRLSRVSRRALTAHGPFVDADSAASFLLEVLGRAERDLARKAVPAVRFGGARWPRVRESSLRGAAL